MTKQTSRERQHASPKLLHVRLHSGSAIDAIHQAVVFDDLRADHQWQRHLPPGSTQVHAEVAPEHAIAKNPLPPQLQRRWTCFAEERPNEARDDFPAGQRHLLVRTAIAARGALRRLGGAQVRRGGGALGANQRHTLRREEADSNAQLASPPRRVRRHVDDGDVIPDLKS